MKNGGCQRKDIGDAMEEITHLLDVVSDLKDQVGMNTP